MPCCILAELGVLSVEFPQIFYDLQNQKLNPPTPINSEPYTLNPTFVVAQVVSAESCSC